MAKAKRKKRIKLKITQDKLFLGMGVALFIVLIGFIIFAMFLLNYRIAPIFSSDNVQSNGGVKFDIEGFKELGL